MEGSVYNTNNQIQNAISFTLPYPPSVNHYWGTARSKRLGGAPLIYVKPEGKAYCNQVKAIFWFQKKPIFADDSRVGIEIMVHPPDKRVRDLDNIFKGVFDSLTKAGVMKDDCMINKITIERKEVKKGGELDVKMYNY